jgi:hypothetical protein
MADRSPRGALAGVALIAIFLFAPQLGFAEGPEADPAAATRILAALGIPDDLEEIPGEARAQVEAGKDGIAPADRDRLRAIVSCGFDPDTVYALVLDDFLTRFDPDSAAEATGWLDTPSAKRILDRSRGRAAGDACLESLPMDALGLHVTSERDALLRRVVGATGAAGRELRRAALVFSAMLLAGNALLPDTRRYLPEELQIVIASQRAGLARAYAVDLRALHCLYRDVETEELRAAARFLDSKSGRWMSDSVAASLQRALVLAAEATALHIVDAFGAGPPDHPLRTAARRFGTRPVGPRPLRPGRWGVLELQGLPA